MCVLSYPQRDMEARQAGFVHSRDLRRRRHSLVGRDRVSPDRAALHMPHGIRGLIDHQVDLSGDEILQRRSRAAVGNELKLGADRILEIDAGKVRTGADPGGAGGDLAAVGLDPGDQLAQALGRHRVLGDDHHRIAADQADRVEVVDEIELKRVDRAVDHMRAQMADADRIAVGRRSHRTTDADGSAGAP